MSDYFISESSPRGGKAGRGCNKTATIRVCKNINMDSFLILKQFRYNVGDLKTKMAAFRKAEIELASLENAIERSKPECSDEPMKRQ